MNKNDQLSTALIKQNTILLRLIVHKTTSGVARRGAEKASALPEILRKLKNYFNGL